MELFVELSGLARALTGEKPVALALPQGASYHDVVFALSTRFPALVGIVVAPNRRDLLNANIFSRDGADLILEEGMDGKPMEGEKLLLLSVIVGG